MRLRASTVADVAFLRDLHRRACRDVVVRQFGSWDDAVQSKFFETQIAELPFSIVEHDGVDIGAIGVREDEQGIHVVELQILPEWQNRGLGSMLLHQQIEAADARGKSVHLRILRENRARALYERHGFSIVGETPTHCLMARSATSDAAQPGTRENPPAMQFRTMTAQDIPDAVELWRSCDGVGMSDSDTPEELAAFLVRNPGLSLLAISGGALAGAVLVGHDGRRGFLYHLAVRASARGQGIARQLVDRALAGLKAAGILKCHIMVFRTNEEGRRFWSHLGWNLRDDLQVLSRVLE